MTTTMTQDQIKNIIGRIEKNVTVNEESGCWEWNLYKNKNNGYGQFWVGKNEHGKYIWNNVHRVAYEVFWGEVPEGKEVAHKCHNRSCCNPNHLVAATHQENVQMSVDAGRCLKGAERFNAKLTDEMVRIVKEGSIFNHLSLSAVARMFNVHHTTLASILKGNTWSHVTV